ncbi:MAG TPA: 3,4-dehydroadipyl-CoA semialdehyde dehydrogenase [Terriglobales bacterium]|nr:3,4-dehydroadipyl-CoA semialdehyde dehydrogenase [Terriglobales bacterium]
MNLESYVSGEWKAGSGEGEPLVNPVTGEELARASSDGLDLSAALEYSRRGSRNLQKLTYAERAGLLSAIAKVLEANRQEYFDISRRNQGATKADASFDVDGAIYTLKQYAKLGQSLTGRMLKDGETVPLSKTGVFGGQHYLKPLEGVAIFINAFNFPAWGLWEKAAPALLSGVAVFVKPATATAWLTQRMVKDVFNAGVLPEGALSILCGSPRDLLDHVREHDVVSITGSANTAVMIKSHPNVVARSVRVNVEADSLNSAILGPDSGPGTQPFELLLTEVVREMTLKAGQKCTAIRRILVPRPLLTSLADAITKKLGEVKVGSPEQDGVTCGPLVSKKQQQSALADIAKLKQEAQVVFGGSEDFRPLGVSDPSRAAFVQPTLLVCDSPRQATTVHEIEVFGPVATLMPYDTLNEAVELANRGRGSLVASIYSDDADFKQQVTLGIASSHGRIMVVDSSVGPQHTGHGNVMPSCLHGGPGRAGGGEELAGLRALHFYHRRFVVQGPPSLIDTLSSQAHDASSLTS